MLELNSYEKLQEAANFVKEESEKTSFNYDVVGADALKTAIAVHQKDYIQNYLSMKGELSLFDERIVELGEYSESIQKSAFVHSEAMMFDTSGKYLDQAAKKGLIRPDERKAIQLTFAIRQKLAEFKRYKNIVDDLATKISILKEFLGEAKKREA